jgi:ring-1,2-phenylacetyl-CoA epoxidase subunit PaaC
MNQLLHDPLFEYCIRTGDDLVVIGHRLSEWCGHAPILEEDIALANIALDCLGQGSYFLGVAAEMRGDTTADRLAFFRETVDYRNCLLVEQPNGDFASTIVRQFFFDVYSHLLNDRLRHSTYPPLAAIAQKAYKEAEYHVRHSGQWTLRLGDGTEESHLRSQRAVNDLWRFTGELFESDPIESSLSDAGVVPSSGSLRSEWMHRVIDTLSRAGLTTPLNSFMQSGGRRGRHTEHLGHMLAEMQIVARSHPEATW